MQHLLSMRTGGAASSLIRFFLLFPQFYVHFAPIYMRYLVPVLDVSFNITSKMASKFVPPIYLRGYIIISLAKVDPAPKYLETKILEDELIYFRNNFRKDPTEEPLELLLCVNSEQRTPIHPYL